MALVIRADDLASAATQELLTLHLTSMQASSPPGFSFALDLEGLRALSVWSAWEDDRIAGIAALKEHSDGSGELKSMRTHPDFLRRGVAAALLEHVITEARARGLRRLSLETGTGEPFEAALGLYRRRGFIDGDAFGDYTRSPHNQFLHLPL